MPEAIGDLKASLREVVRMGQEADPIVLTLWRILHFLDHEDGNHSATVCPAAVWDHYDPWVVEHHHLYPHHDDDVTTPQPINDEPTRSRGRSRERKRKDLNSNQDPMTTPPRPASQSLGRGRTPSPKRTPAPAPPNPLRCPSPAPKAVGTCDVLPTDQQGWLIDQLRGRRVWCAVADMLFCVFEKPDSKVSKQVLLLPGCNIRQMEFKTASRDNRLVNGLSRKLRSKTISGVDKFQFWIENTTNRQRLTFGVDSKEQLDQWMEVLTRVANVDTDSLGADGGEVGNGNVDHVQMADTNNADRDGSDTDGSDTTPRSSTSSHSPRYRNGGGRGGGGRRSNSGERNGGGSEGGGGGGCAYSPSQTLPRRIDFLSLSLGNAGDVRKDSVEDIRRRLRREHEHTTDAKAAPLKATHEETDAPTSSSSTTTAATATPSSSAAAATSSSSRRRSFFKVGGLDSLFSRSKKRSASADDAVRRKALTSATPPETQRSNDGSSPRGTQTGKSRRIPIMRKLSRTGSQDSTNESAAESKPEGRAFLSRSWDGEKNPDGLGASIRRSASDLKSRLFSGGGSKARDPGLRLEDLTDCRLQGVLHYKGTVRWIGIWAVLCRGCFYGFRSDKAQETPLLVFVLPQCTVSYVTESDSRRSRKQFTFKLSQPHCRSLNLSADTHRDLIRWLQALQQEACKVLAEDDVSSVETDNSSNASVDVVTSGGPRTSSGIPSLSKSWSSLTGNGSECSAAKGDGHRLRSGSEASTCSRASVDSRLLPHGFSAMASSAEVTLHMTSENPVTSEKPDVSSGGSSRIPRPRSMSSVSSKPSNSLTSPRDQTMSRSVNEVPHGDSTDEADTGSVTSQPNTPRHDDALTQVWSKDKGYLLQLIRTRLLRRKKRGDNLAEGESIYNKELARSHEGGLLIQQDEVDDDDGDDYGDDVHLPSQNSSSIHEVRHNK